MQKHIVIILAGGDGNRANTVIPKQFLNVNNIPVVVYTLKVFQETEEIDEICLVVHEEWLEEVNCYRDKYGISKLEWITIGGRTGLESVAKGLAMLKDLEDNTIVLVHDAVRPFITKKTISENIKIAEKYGVAVTAVPCVETLIKVDGAGKSTQQIPRDNLMRVMTPQSFQLGTLFKLFAEVDFMSCDYPSVFALYMSLGYPVYASYGSERNIKITYPEDIEYLKNLFKND